MSDLTATNCGCNSCGCGNNNGILGGNSCIWIIILLFFCGGNNSCGCGNGILGGNNGCDNNSCCDWLIWILLLSFFCGGNNNCGCGNC